MPTDGVDVILDFHGIAGPWKPLKVTGAANRIYATEDIVLRIATEHRDAVVDAQTESLAAPAAFAAGIMTPRLIAFDDSGRLLNGPYSIWERVHAETLGLANLTPSQRGDLWQQVGTQISHLHSKVVSCPDPNGYLDTPLRELSLDSGLQQLVESGHADEGTVREIRLLIRDLSPYLSQTCPQLFVHNDLHEMNIMCQAGQLRALLDWGDAGWGDPTLDFAAIPLDQISAARVGYGASHWRRLGDAPEARFIWDRLHSAMDDAIKSPENKIPVREYRRFLDEVA